MATVLVTGGSGFLGSHCILQLLQAGHAVRTTVRDPAKRDRVLRMLSSAGIKGASPVTFAEADLLQDAGWPDAVAGCEHVLHVASPFPSTVPKDENDLIVPARDGSLRVLRAARDAGVQRVVLTSSFAAVGYGVKARTAAFTEEDWTNLEDPGIQPYQRSKTIAERAAWDFIAREGGALELAVINPVAIFGPVLGADYSASILIVKRLMDGSLPGCPDLWFGAVDVRDVAALHLKAMTEAAARGQRFIATGGDFISVRHVAEFLKEELKEDARRVTTRPLPKVVMRAVALFDPQVKGVLPELSKRKNASNEKARRVLGWTPRSPREAVAATGRSLIELGLLKT